jgi:hypothetical protein
MQLLGTLVGYARVDACKETINELIRQETPSKAMTILR